MGVSVLSPKQNLIAHIRTLLKLSTPRAEAPSSTDTLKSQPAGWVGHMRKTQVKLEGRGNSDIVFDSMRLAIRRKAHEVDEKKFVEVSLLRREKINLSPFSL